MVYDTSPPPFDPDEVAALRPRLTRRYRLKRSIHYTDELARRVDDWFLSYGLLQRPEEQRVFRETNHAYLTAVCWPAAAEGALFDLARLSAALIVRDHEFDSDRHGKGVELTRASLLDMRSQYATRTEPRWAPMFADIWHRFVTYLPIDFMARFADAIAGYLEDCLTYNQMLHHGYQPGGVEEYFHHRRRTIGHAIDQHMAEISLGIQLQPDTLAHPLMQRLHQLDIRRTIAAQDILSARKEFASGEQENLLAVIALSQGCPLSDALHQATAIYQHEMDRYDQAHRDLLASPLARRQDVPAYATALTDLHAGLVEWSTGSVCYTLEEFSRWNPPDALIDGGQPPDQTLDQQPSRHGRRT
jgi:hypothetical protein